MNRIRHISLTCAAIFGLLCFAYGQQNRHVLYLGAHAHLGTGKDITNSAIAVQDGRFTLVGNALLVKIEESKYDTVIRLDGKHVYPGFIAPNSTIGLTEIDAVRATLDVQEVGRYKPHIRSIIAYNTDSEITPTVRSNGILLAQITPRGGVVTGSSSIVLFEGNNWEDALYKENDGIHINWPRMYKRSGWWAEPGTIEKDAKYHERVKALQDFLKEAKAYSEVKKPETTDLRMEAMKGVFEGSRALYVKSDYIKEIMEIIQLKRDLGIPRLVLVGGYDSWLVPELLVENKIPVMLKRLHSLPERPEDDIDLPFKLPKMLSDAGVLFCLENAGDMEAMNTRNLPFYAGTAAAYGLNYEEAVAAITLNTAKILGIDKRTGSIEAGKDANFFISSGDALDMRTNDVEQAFVMGESIDLGNRQLDLYRKYAGKYGLEIKD